MDSHNLFDTPATYRAHRAEYLVGLAVAVVLLAIHIEDVRILPAIALFYYNDVFGYIPGAIAFRRSRDGRISKNYYRLYNVMHSIVTSAVVLGLYALIAGPEWAMVAQAVHVCVDRAVFGNFLKPYSVSFEPRTHPVYAVVKPLLERPVEEDEAAELLAGRAAGDVAEERAPRLTPAQPVA
ncbi:MAG: hypothetical protein M3340_09610 [Actinomycetota bacterium]|nr:hypothetical protein [Actinomycetota bacterium]